MSVTFSTYARKADALLISAEFRFAFVSTEVTQKMDHLYRVKGFLKFVLILNLIIFQYTSI